MEKLTPIIRPEAQIPTVPFGRPSHPEANEKKKHWIDFATAFATVAMAALTVVLAYIYWQQKVIAQDQEAIAQNQVMIAKDQEIRQLRAYVGFTGSKVIDSADSGVLRVEFDLKNFGMTPATDVQMSYSTAFISTGIVNSTGALNMSVDTSNATYQRADTDTIVYPNNPISPTIDLTGFSQDQMGELEGGNAEIAWFGSISYTDVFGTTRTSEFCMIFLYIPTNSGVSLRSVMCANHRDVT